MFSAETQNTIVLQILFFKKKYFKYISNPVYIFINLFSANFQLYFVLYKYNKSIEMLGLQYIVELFI